MLRNIRYGNGWNSFPSLVVLILFESWLLLPSCVWLLCRLWVWTFRCSLSQKIIPQYTHWNLCSLNNSSCLSWGSLWRLKWHPDEELNEHMSQVWIVAICFFWLMCNLAENEQHSQSRYTGLVTCILIMWSSRSTVWSVIKVHNWHL